MARQRRIASGNTNGVHKATKFDGSNNTTPAGKSFAVHNSQNNSIASNNNLKNRNVKHTDTQSSNSGSNNSEGTSTSSTSTRTSGNLSSTSLLGGSSIKSKVSHGKKKNPFILSARIILDQWKTLITCICLGVASYFCYLGYLETRVNTPFDNQKMVVRTGLDESDRYWGTYRPLNYFGLKTRDPHSLVMGLMWYSSVNLDQGARGIRHWCELNDKLDRYGWMYHDARSFGVQEIHDKPFELKTSFVKYPIGKQLGGDWTARISVRNITNIWDRTLSLIWYVALDERTLGRISYLSDEQSPEPGIYGETTGLGEFQVKLNFIKGRILHKSYLSTVSPSLSRLTDTVYSHLRVFSNKQGRRFVGLPGEMISQNSVIVEPNFIAIQFVVESDFTIDITYQSTSSERTSEILLPRPPIGREFTKSLQDKMNTFNTRFEEKFHLRAKGFSAEQIKFAKYALSNMLGGIGYFYGSSRVQSVHTKNPVPYWKTALYTAVPSRSFFPRGFLWDEGFHGLLISSWDLDIELDIMCHWFDLLNVEGWIPREQILGVEALAKVPDEFVIQRNSNANPPTFFLTLQKILTHYKQQIKLKGRLSILNRLYPRLQAWFDWYNSTQKGDIFGSYRWRGRDANSKLELNPKTLTSGLDDFPRASHPTYQERHVDLRCWIALAAAVMANLTRLLEIDDGRYSETAAFLYDNRLLNDQHLSPYTEFYADWGLHTDSVVLKKRQYAQKNMLKQKNQIQQEEMVRVTLKDPDYKFVDSTFGYVNLFPFLLEILEANSTYLNKILNDLYDPHVLWTNYGLRSLSKNSPLYMKRNTEHDPPYWRGPIWININYLALKALKHYSTVKGPYTNQAHKIYAELRENVVNNMFREYQRTGYIWEQYDDSTGHGKGCNPFTGWSSLVLLIMAEEY